MMDPCGHPDADLLAVCAQLRTMEDSWQRLYTDGPREEYADYVDRVWPGIALSCEWWVERHPELAGQDVVARLLQLRATTPEGLRAKAAAVLAMQEAACWGADFRNDSSLFVTSLLEDAAGPLRRPMGDDAC